MDNFPENKIHIGGLSAGGNLSCVIGMEALLLMRRQKKKNSIKSILVDIPMISPTLQTKSVYQNQVSARACPVLWLRWCWAAYLQLEEKDREEGETKVNSVIDFTNEISYQRALNNKMKKILSINKIGRFIDPTMFKTKEEAESKHKTTKIIVHTQTADALLDEGIQFYRALLHNKIDGFCDVKHYSSKCSHAYGHLTFLGNSNYKKVIEEWSKSFLGEP